MRDFEKAPPEARELLRVPIRELGLRLEGSRVERFVEKLYEELEAKGLRRFRPACYLTDQWGCPSEEPIIGIPFYLADPRTEALERAMNDLEDEREIMMYLRHEAGHAFNYAYELYKRDEWRKIFGPFRRAYRDRYKPVPFSKRFVRHIAGWYAQKHPDEDFAETFAVWLTPRSDWRRRYAGWPAMEKLKWVDATVRELGETDPVRLLGEVDFTVAEMETTVEDFYRENVPDERAEIGSLPLATDLEDIFPRSENSDGRAADLIAKNKKTIIDKITYWSGVRRPLVKALIECIEEQLSELDLPLQEGAADNQLIELTTYAATLAMNYLTRGRFVHE